MMAGTLDRRSRTRVSFREVKEESYRAFRSAGYSWGQAQAMGRIAGAMQVLWGTGISAVIVDARRWAAASRIPRTRAGKMGHTVSPRGLSIVGLSLTLATRAVARPDEVLWVRSAKPLREFAAALWDLDLRSGPTIFWGSHSSRGTSGYSLDAAGNLQEHLVLDGDSMGLGPSRGGMWVRGGPATGGNIVLSADERRFRMAEALVSGVSIDSHEWAVLARLSRKFLVPES
jgi:hypothetical protein